MSKYAFIHSLLFPRAKKPDNPLSGFCHASSPRTKWVLSDDMKILINPEELWIAFFTRNNPFYNSVMDNFIRHLTQVRFVKSLSMTILLGIFLLLILLAKAFFPRQIRKKELWFLLSTIIIGLGYFFLLVATFLGTQKPGQTVIEERRPGESCRLERGSRSSQRQG